MSKTQTESEDKSNDSIRLNRSLYKWITAESSASFVLRYVLNLRGYLIEGLKTDNLADDVVKEMIQALVQSGYRNQTQQRLRDYLAEALQDQVGSLEIAKKDESIKKWMKQDLNPESLTWMRFWRDCLLERAWRSLERNEHETPNEPYYSILHCATAHPSATSEMLSVQIAADHGLKIEPRKLESLLTKAKGLFAQLLADEVSESLSDNSHSCVLHEIQALGLNRAFEDVSIQKE